MSKVFNLGRLVALLTLIPLVAACPGSDEASRTGSAENEIPIGVYASLTGPTGTFGQSTKEGVELAVDEVNAAGGLLGRQVRMYVEDNGGKPDQAVTTVTKLITRNGVVALIGENASSRSLAAAPIAQANGIPMISPTSTNPEVTQKGDYIFRVCYTDPYQGAAIAQFVSEGLGLERVAVLRDVKNDYSVGLAEFFTSAFEEDGGEVVIDLTYAEGDADFRSQLTSIRNSSAEAIVIPGYYTDVGQIAVQARDLGIELPLVGGDGWDSPKLTEIGGEAIEGAYFANHYFVDEERPAVQEFVSRFEERYGRKPDSVNALSYDAAILLFDAIRRAGTDDPAAIRDALAATDGFQAVSGVINMGPDRTPIKPVVILQVEDGRFTMERWVNPGEESRG